MKNITKITISAVILIVFIYLLISIQIKQEVSSNITAPDFMMELKDIRLRGWNKEKVVWEMKATNAYYYDKNTLVLMGVKEGFFLDNNGESLIEEMVISTVNANIFKKECILNDVMFKFNSENKSSIILTANLLVYQEGVFNSEKQYSLESEDWKITSGKIKYDTNTNIMEFFDNVVITKDKSSLYSVNGSFSPKINELQLSKNVVVSYCVEHEGKEYLLKVKADATKVILKQDEPEFAFDRGMIFSLGDDVLEAGKGNYESNKQLMKMKDVLIRVDDGSQILNNIDNKEIKGSLIKGKEVNIDFKEKIVKLSGNVSYDRNQRKIKSNFGTYDVEKGLLYMNGEVSIVEGNKTIRSNDVIVDVKNDIIIAKGNVKTKLKI